MTIMLADFGQNIRARKVIYANRQRISYITSGISELILVRFGILLSI